MQLRNTLLLRCRKRTAAIIEMGSAQDWVSRGYDILSGLMLLANLSASILYTFNSMALQYGSLLVAIEAITVAFFAVDYALRLWTAPEFFPKLSSFRSVWKYVFSLTGIVDLLSFLPYYLPIFFPAGAAVFRIFRVVRIFRLFQINAYYSAMNVITEVLRSRRQQLASSVFIILVLMLASSLCMYSLEHEAQPEVFSNAFSGIWWAVSTLLTVGYGDIYPITTAGKIVSIFITFLGVVWLLSPPVLFRQVLLISFPASSGSVNMQANRISNLSKSNCKNGTVGWARPSKTWNFRTT